jgi:hypothetical protein
VDVMAEDVQLQAVPCKSAVCSSSEFMGMAQSQETHKGGSILGRRAETDQVCTNQTRSSLGRPQASR